MVKKILNVSIDSDVAKSVQYNLDSENEQRKKKMKTELNKSEYIQNLIVVGLIIRTNKREDIPKILDAYFADETGGNSK